MAVKMNPRKGYFAGIMSGVTWGLDAVMLGVVMVLTPFVENPVLLAAGGVLCSALHDIIAAIWLYIYMGAKGRLKELGPAIKTRDGKFCSLGALLGGPLAMTTYTLSIAVGGAALTTSVSAIYPLLGTALAVWILKEKTGIQTWIGIAICIVGIIVIGWTPSSNEEVNITLGIILALITAVGWASEGVVCGYGMKAGVVDPELGLLIRYSTSALVYLLVVAPVFAGGFGFAVDGHHYQRDARSQRQCHDQQRDRGIGVNTVFRDRPRPRLDLIPGLNADIAVQQRIDHRHARLGIRAFFKQYHAVGWEEDTVIGAEHIV